MSRQEVDIGIVGNDGTGDSIREAFRKVNDNFKEIYSVFNQGDTISFQDLGNVTVENSNTILTTIDTGSGIRIVDRVLDGGNSISVEYEADKINIRAIGTSLDSDTSPSLAGPLRGNNYPIANIAEPSQQAIAVYNTIHPDDPVTINDLAITKGYADKNYLRKSGGSSSSISGQIRVRDEPLDNNDYILNVNGTLNNNVVVNSHGFDSAFDGAAYIYETGGVPATNLARIISVTDSNHFIIGRAFRIQTLGNVDFTSLGALRNKVGEIFILTNTGSISGYGTVLDLEGGDPQSIPTTVIDGGSPSTTTFTNVYNGGTPNIVTVGSTGTVRPIYFLKYVNSNELSIHPSFIDAQNGTSKISYSGGTGFQIFIDAFYDSKLEGNWLSNEVLPRKSVVRRQGDKMDGPLMLHDHPFPLLGAGTPNRPDDLQAASKYYVDNSSFASEVNLYVSTTGNDQQTDTPSGKEGRAWAYAFKTVSKSCEVAESLMNNAVLEPGPYRQTITYTRITSGISESFNSIVTLYTPPNLNGLARLRFTNNNGGPVDQGSSPTIEIIPGKIVRGKISGATGIIFTYKNDATSLIGEDYVDLEQVKGIFLLGESLEYAAPVTNLHITIHVESGIYEEDFPIKLPNNTAIVGDEFRRVLIRPKDRISRSPWVYTWFFRNTTFDNLTIAQGNGPNFNAELSGYYGYHYLKNSSALVNRGTNYTNVGEYDTEANLIQTNKTSIQNAVRDFINQTAIINGDPLLNSIEEQNVNRDVGYILDGIIHDLKEGGIDKIFDLQETFSQSNIGNDIKDGIEYISTFINSNIISSSSITVKNLVTKMIQKILFGFDPAYNTPKNNKDMDVFLCNDSSIVRQITCQGHGGFMMVLDPDGQILSKSPYCQQSGSFSASINRQAFRGGQYIDGFTGNLTYTVSQYINTTTLKVTGVPKEPNTPSSFFINGQRYKVDSWVPENGADINARDLLQVNKEFIKVQTINSLSTTYTTIKFPEADILRHIDRFIDAITFDTVVGGNSKTLIANRRLFTSDTEFFIYSNDLIPLVLSMLDYIKTIACEIIVNQTVTPNQNNIIQTKIIGRSGTFGSQNKIVNLIDNVKTTINQGLDFAAALSNPTFVLKLDPATPILANPIKITIITPGNTSMLSNDYTQVNDLGYGIVTNNNGLAECVSVFSYYCYTGMFSSNGGQIRSLNSSSANGEYGLVALGSDPLEVPDQVTLVDNSIQVARIVKTGQYASSGLIETLSIYVEDFEFVPYNVSIVEINHGAGVGIVRYEMNNITVAERDTITDYPTIIRLNFNTAGNNDTSKSGLAATVNDGDLVIIRSGQNFKFKNVLEVNPTRPSTALTFEGDPANDQNAPVYRVISYNTKNPDNSSMASDESILTFDATYNYIPLIVQQDKLSILVGGVTVSQGSSQGDTKIAIKLVTSVMTANRLNTGQMITAWNGKVHRILSYTPVTSENYGYITITNLDSSGSNLPNLSGVTGAGISSSLVNNDTDIILRAGLAKDENANITVSISTMRATGHDFLDVGTGGYNTSNYPSKIYGDPKSPSQAREIDERNRGRVFYVSTDQDGFFRVGRFFTVDQGTGTVTFAASIALSNLDGIGFKRGISVSEFSTDDRFEDLAEDSVPTEAAISRYIDRRLGFDRAGFILGTSDFINNHPGYISRNANIAQRGPTTNISWNSKKLTDLGTPTTNKDAANKEYVDDVVAGYSNLKQLKDVLTINSSPSGVLMFTGLTGEAVAASIDGDLESFIDSGIKSTLTQSILGSGAISTISVVDASQFPTIGFVLIGKEVFSYNTFTSSGTVQTLNGVNRLSESTDPTLKFTLLNPEPHSVGDYVYGLSAAKLNLQIKSNTIVNADINSNAGIVQSKLLLNLSTSLNVAPTGTTADKQAASGLSSFDDDNFSVTDGWVKIKDGGIARIEQEDISTNKILGNLGTAATYPQELTPESVLKRATWDALNSSSTLQRDHVFTFRPSTTEAASVFSTTEINTNVTANSIAKRTANGNLKITNLDSNGSVSIISISGTVILSGVTYAGNGVFNCTATTLSIGGRVFIQGNNTGDLILPSYNPSGTNYYIIDTNGNTQFKLSSTLGGSAINTTGTTIVGLTFINATGTEDNATPVTYKGQWSPGNAASFRATQADAWSTARTITVDGDASGTVSINGSSDVTLTLDVSYATNAGTAAATTSSLTFKDDGTGDISTSVFNGSNNRIISYNSIGAPKYDGTGASGTWPINIGGTAAGVTNSKFQIDLRNGNSIDIGLTVGGFNVLKNDGSTVTIQFSL